MTHALHPPALARRTAAAMCVGGRPVKPIPSAGNGYGFPGAWTTIRPNRRPVVGA